MSSLAYLLPATAAAVAFYLASAHQRLAPALRARTRALRVAAWAATSLSLALAHAQLGAWAGAFAALTALMAGMVALPYLDAWWQLRRGGPHVG
ncbi:hypothetical protein QFW77_18620 [Luteimonas sp. RD2P54]|uniref:DUF3325 domain-containing protein n=1 Tax=Luteimonas endophytica TaxID=3042023 RepID=A0ABT6JDT7_9GAMM|nr:hypothetical protein [Luteimonas endophytica]MDH5824985.1 hypothetical protein [Luteimonas endophytica]